MKKSIITADMEHCVICGSPDVAIHHVLSGTSGRALSDADGLILPLCPKHHNMDRKESVHLNSAIARWSKITGQLAYESEMIASGKAETKDQAREMFRRKYNKSYL